MLEKLEELTSGKSFDSVIRVVSRFFQCFKNTYVACILVCLYLVWFVCFCNLLNEAYLEPFQITKMELFVKIVND